MYEQMTSEALAESSKKVEVERLEALRAAIATRKRDASQEEILASAEKIYQWLKGDSGEKTPVSPA